MDGCGIQAAAALALVIPTAAACSWAAAAFVRAITFVFDFLSAAALNEPGLIVFLYVLMPGICDVAVAVPGYVSLGVLGLRFIAAAVAAATACVGVLMVALSYEFSGGSFKTPDVVIWQPAAAARGVTMPSRRRLHHGWTWVTPPTHWPVLYLQVADWFTAAAFTAAAAFGAFCGTFTLVVNDKISLFGHRFGCYDAFVTGRHCHVKHAVCKRDTTGGRGRGDVSSPGKLVAWKPQQK